MDDRYVILLDGRQRKCGGNNYCVTFIGTLAECREMCGQFDSAKAVPWEMSRWKLGPKEPCSMRDMASGIAQPGGIFRLEKR